MLQANFLDGLHQQDMSRAVETWRPPQPPDLSGVDEIFMDLESSGLAWWNGDRMIGGAFRTRDGRSWYLPIRHEVGPNLDEDIFFRWVRTELRGKRIVNTRTKFDLHMLRQEGIDLEAQGCTFGDVAHYAALLDDHRRLFNQRDLVKDFLGEEVGKLRAAHGFNLDPGKFAEYPAGLVATRAEHDVLMVHLLQDHMWPRLDAEDLQRVRALEDGIIPVVVEMEENGAPLKVETLDAWCLRSKQELEQAMWDIQRASGCKLSTPNKRDDLMKLFSVLRIDVPRDPETGEPSFADNLLEPLRHPVIEKLRLAIQLASLRSKFLLKYQRSVARDGILRYELHQLPYQDDDGGGGGAVSGRFSSAAMTYFEGKVQKKEGANIQQVFGVKQQEKSFTRDYPIRQLFVPRQGDWLAADASQIEYRMFAHFANSRPIIEAYQNDSSTDYHQLVHDLILKHTGKDLPRVQTKNINFACVASETPILKSDLTWVSAGTLKEGDQLLAFDENKREGIGRKGARRWRIATVTENVPDQRECAEILLENNDRLIATLDHRWIIKNAHVRHDWRRTDQLEKGDLLVLIQDFTRALPGTMFQARRHVKVLSVKNVGLRSIAALGTSEATFIAAGYAAHNTIFGAGVARLAEQLGVEESVARALSDTYHGMFPEVKPLLRKASHLSMPEHKIGDHGCGRQCREFHRRGLKHRGYVRTALGRRARFGPQDRHYSGLNRVIQGTAADYNKLVLIELHRRRHELCIVPRYTVHDEFNGDLKDPGMLSRITEVFNTQYLDLKVPILWNVGVGRNWAEAKGGHKP